MSASGDGGLMYAWGSYGVDAERLRKWSEGMAFFSIKHALTPNLLLRSQVQANEFGQPSSQTVFKYKPFWYKTVITSRLGLNVAPWTLPSLFWTTHVPVGIVAGSVSTIRTNLNKAPWRPMPYFGVSMENRWKHVAVTTRLGSNPGEKMDQEPISMPDVEVEHSINVGDGPFSVGGHVRYEPDFTQQIGVKVTDYNLGAEYKVPNNKSGEQGYCLTVRTAEKMSKIKGDVWTQMNRAMRLGVNANYDIPTQSANSGISVQYNHTAPNPSMSAVMKAKVNTTGEIGGHVAISTKEQSRISIGGTSNPRNSNRSTFVIGLSVGDY